MHDLLKSPNYVSLLQFRILTNSLMVFELFSHRQLSRHLVGLWTAENPIAMNLLKRILVRL